VKKGGAEMENKKIDRRDFLKKLGILTGSAVIAPFLPGIVKKDFSLIENAHADIVSNIFVSKNGDPITNVQKVVDMAGGIASYIDYDDIVVIKGNGQWSNQGYTHTQAIKSMIDVILARPGGFGGEIVLAENIHFNNSSLNNNCWVQTAANRARNWSAYNWRELISAYQSGVFGTAHPNVIKAELCNSATSGTYSGDGYSLITSPSQGRGYVSNNYTIQNCPGTPAQGRTRNLYYFMLQSSYSGKVFNLHRNGGVWVDGAYNSQKIKMIFMPNLNSHATSSESYAGVTSAVKCHIGFNAGDGMHYIGYSDTPSLNVPRATGEAVGWFITNTIQPTLYVTVAEWAGWGGRTSDDATQTKTIGLCTDPVALDYWMAKNVLYPTHTAYAYLNPENDNNTRKTLEGCQAMGVGTINESEMLVSIYDYNNPLTTRLDIEKKIKQLKEGAATQSEVMSLIDMYMKGQ